MNRRGFLSAMLGGAAALTLDPERLLWRPGAKLISIPPARCDYPFSDEAMDFLKHYVRPTALRMAELIDQDIARMSYSLAFKHAANTFDQMRIGDTITIRKPQRYRSFATA